MRGRALGTEEEGMTITNLPRDLKTPHLNLKAPPEMTNPSPAGSNDQPIPSIHLLKASSPPSSVTTSASNPSLRKIDPIRGR